MSATPSSPDAPKTPPAKPAASQPPSPPAPVKPAARLPRPFHVPKPSPGVENTPSCNPQYRPPPKG